jgi:hypothetical protein
MLSSSSQDDNEIPVIWLLPPEALKPSPDPIKPIPIAISATIVTLIFLTLVILYNKKPKATNAERKDIELKSLKASIRVIRPASAALPIPTPSALPTPRSPPPHPARSPAQSQIESGSDTITEPSITVKTYHEALEGIRDASYNSSTGMPTSTSTTADSCYFSPKSTTNNDFQANSPREHHIIRPASSDYSVSIGPTPLPSRHNSVRHREINGACTRLHLRSEYDGDRTFVPSEANLRLGKGK